MSVAYIILAHHRPGQLARLVDRLLCPGADVFVHVDRGTHPAVHAQLVDGLPRSPGVHLLPRVRSRWASWGIVQAVLTGIEAALAARPGISHAIIMSGQDYPLRPAEEIVGFLDRAAPLTFLGSFPLPSSNYGADGGRSRVRYWQTPLLGRRVRAPIPRRYPSGLRPWGGTLHAALDAESARYLVDFTRNNPDIARFHRHVWIPDEHYVPTVLMSSPRATHVRDESLWHVQWPPPPAKHPKLLREEDFPGIAVSARRSSDVGGPSRAKLFARKFAEDVDCTVLSRIDAELLDR